MQATLNHNESINQSTEFDGNEERTPAATVDGEAANTNSCGDNNKREFEEKMWRGQVKLILYLTSVVIKKQAKDETFTMEQASTLWVDLDVKRKGSVSGDRMG